MLTRLRRRTWGQTLAELGLVCGILSSMGGGAGAAWQVLAASRRTDATSNLKQIYAALLITAEDGQLPNAVFYPDTRRDPNAVRTDPRCIVNQIRGLPAHFWISPGAPPEFQRLGLTYVWNSSLNGRLLDQLDPRTWLLMDMNGAAYLLPDLVPKAPGYLVLYADGQVKYETQPPAVMRADQVAQVRAAAGGGVAAGGPTNDPGTEFGTPPGGGPLVSPGAAPPVKVPADPDQAIRQKEETARRNNPDEDDALNE